MELRGTTAGLFPLPDEIKERLSTLKGHQKHDLISGEEDPETEKAYQEARRHVVATQQDAGLETVVEGQLRWDDMLAHPLCVHDNVRTEGIVRYFDNNNFYREPVVEGELDFDGDVARELEAAAELHETVQGVVPGPYTLTELATDEFYGDDLEFLEAVGEFLAGEVTPFPDAVDVLTLSEPSLVVDPPEDELQEPISEAIDAIASAIDADVIVQTYWGALDEKTHAHLLDSDIDAIGYDFVTAPDENLSLIGEYGSAEDIALGLIDGQNTLVESPETIRDRIEWVQDGLPSATSFETAYVTPNSELFYLPMNKFEAKLDAIGTAVETTEVSL